MDIREIGVYMKQNKDSRKGQAAFEFLMTYGWVFLISGIVIASLFHFKVFNPGSYVKPQVFGFSSFLIEDWKVKGDGELIVVINNQIDHDVEVQKVFINKDLVKVYSPGEFVRTGNAISLSEIPTGKTGRPGVSSYKISTIIEYEDIVTGRKYNDTGTLIGRFE